MAFDIDRAALAREIDGLPQAAKLHPQDVEKWLNGMIDRVQAAAANAPATHKGQNPTTDILWHIRRAGGIGGCEAGAAQLHERKEYYHDVNLPTLYDEKLLRKLPDVANHHMERGTYLEPVAQAMFHTRYNTHTDEKAREALRAFRGWPAYQWLVGNEDDIVVLGGKRYLVDYKMPAEAPNEPSFMQKAQLTHYWMKAHVAGVKIDGLILANVVLPGADAWVDAIKADPAMLDHAIALGKTLASQPDNNARIQAHGIARSMDFAKLLIKTNDAVWKQNIMAGKRPRYFKRGTVVLSDDEQQRGAVLAESFARNKAIAEAAEIAMGVDRDALAALLEDKTLDKNKQPFPVLSVSNTDTLDAKAARTALVREGADEFALSKAPVYDTETLAALATKAGVDIEAALVPGSADSKKIQNALADHETLDVTEFSKPGFRVGLSRAPKGPGHEAASRVRTAAAATLGAFHDRDLTLDEPAPADTAPAEAAEQTLTSPQPS